MRYIKTKLILNFSRYGVLHRDVLKNDITALKSLIQQGFVNKIHKNGRVFYELTQKALLLLEHQRKKLLEEAKLRALLEHRNTFYSSLLDDIRFIDETRPEAQDFLFLGSWELKKPVVSGQLELAKFRFYKNHVLAKQRKAL